MNKPTTRTPAQQHAIESTASQIVVVAGPGSGKTATTVQRILSLIELGTDPASIVAITFTNAAANELRHRINRSPKTGEWGSEPDVPVSLGYIGTLHSFALRMLKQYGEAQGYGERISIISAESATELLETKAKQLGCKLKTQDLLELKAKWAPTPGRMTLAETVVASYYHDLKESGIVDFDNLLQAFLEMVENNDEANARIAARFTSLFVDEMQDSSSVDWDIYDQLPIARKFYVGDPDQAIYSFRGGRVEHLIERAKSSKVQTIVLEDNFRSHTEICQAAQRLIERNADRVQKQTRSRKGIGGTIEVHAAGNEGEESAIVIRRIQQLDADMSIAVLCRTNAVAYEYRQQLRANGLPVAEPKRSTLPKDWPMARALVELLGNPENDTLAKFYLRARFTALGHPPAKVRELVNSIVMGAAVQMKTINQAHLLLPAYTVAAGVLGTCITQGVSAESRMLLNEVVTTVGPEAPPLELALAMNSMRDGKPEENNTLIQVLTIHGAKGLEFDAVFLVGFEDQLIPGRANSQDAIAEERRLAYVAITRARKHLTITHSATRKTSWGSISQNTPSRFIKEAKL